jgi:WD40 repeat protein
MRRFKSFFGCFYSVWNFETARCRRKFRHRHVVLSVDVSDNLVVSGCEGWKVKVWDIESATLIKVRSKCEKYSDTANTELAFATRP